MNIFYVDCGDGQYWLYAQSVGQAESVAAELAGHRNVNECLNWRDHMKFANFETVAAVEAALTAAGETVYRGKPSD